MQTVDRARLRRRRRSRHADGGRHQLAPIVSRGAHAGPVRRAGAGAAAPRWRSNLWWSWDQRHDQPVPRSRSRCCGARLGPQPGRAAAADPGRHARRARLAAGAARPHQLRLPAPARNTWPRRDTWGARHAGVLRARPVAYFSAEFGLHESLPIYSGGLGILAGDHIKAASDLGIPLVGVGLYYDQGYFRQRLDRDGWPAGGVPRRRRRDCCRSRRRRPRTASRHRDRSRPAPARSRRASGRCRSAAPRCCCSTPTSKATRPRIAS